MPIFHTTKPEVQPTWVGLVLSIMVKIEQIMSDVYVDATYAVCWDGSKPQHIRLYDSEFGGDLRATVDATPSVLTAFAVWTNEQAALRIKQEEAARQEASMERVLTVTVGAQVTAIKGRKVKIGTTGVATRMDMNGTRICFTDGTTGVQTWSDTDNFCRVDRCLPDGMSWTEYEDSLYVPTAEFSKGDTIRIKSSGKVGVVFWKRDGRYGVTPSSIRDPNTGQYTDAIWCGVSEMEYAF